MAEKKYQTILYDLDGTLIDHFEAIHRCYAAVQREMGLPEADYEKVRRTVGGSIPVTMERLVGPERAGPAVRLFKEKFPEFMYDGVAWLPGVELLIPAMRKQGYGQAVLTNKDGDPARRVLAHLGAGEWFDLVLGADDTPWRKPQAEFTRAALDRMRAEPAHTCLIGDSPFDYEAARAGGLDCYLVNTGSHTADELEPLGAEGVYPSMVALMTDLGWIE